MERYTDVVAGARCSAMKEAATRAADGRGPDTLLLQAFTKHFQLAAPSELVNAVAPLATTPEGIAGCSPPVFEACEKGDRVAEQIIQQGACALAEHVAVLVNRLNLDPQQLPLALAGGMLVNQTDLRLRVADQLINRGIHAKPISQVKHPAAGALLLAKKRMRYEG